MLPVFITPEGLVLDARKATVTPLPEVPPTEPLDMSELCREAAIEAEKASTKRKVTQVCCPVGRVTPSLLADCSAANG